MTPDQCHIDHALRVAAQSPCRSKRGVVLFHPTTGAVRGAGFNGPPIGGCPGRSVCAGKCGQLSVHAEMRALRAAALYLPNYADGMPDGTWELLHVELAADGGVVACDGPSCVTCSREIADVGFVGGVWLYEREQWPDATGGWDGRAQWRRYSAEEFHRTTLRSEEFLRTTLHNLRLDR